MNYIWQHKHWPKFSYDSSKLSALAYHYAKQAAQLSGSLAYTDLDDSISAQLDLMVDEAINTSLIEGESLNPTSVRSSLQNYLNLTPTPINVADVKAEGMAALLVDVRKYFNKPLSKETLFSWHRMVLAGFEDNILHSALTVGQWRDTPETMQIVSGPSLSKTGYERVHYEAPAAQNLEAFMAEFLNWFNNQDSHQDNQEDNQQLPGVIRAGIAHLWFEVIHPFDDGNGRVGRAIIEYALAQDLGMPVVLSMSTHIEKNKKEYYRQLNAASCCDASELDDPAVLDITVWLSWFIHTLIAAQQEAAEKVVTIFEKTDFWQRHKNTALSERQKAVINKVFKAGKEGFPNGISAQKYAALGKCSKATATRDLGDLLAKKCVWSEGVGRGLRYFIALSPAPSA